MFNLSKIPGLSVKTDITGEVHSKPDIKILTAEVSSLFGRDRENLSAVPVSKGEMTVKQKLPDIREETSLVPRDIPKAKDDEFTFAAVASFTGKASEKYETTQKGHTIKNCYKDLSSDGTPVTKWEGVNQDKTTYKAEGKETENTVEITSRGINGEFEGRTELIKENLTDKKETLYIKNNKTGNESTYTIETKGRDEKHRGTLKTSDGDFMTCEIEKSGGKITRETFLTEFEDGGIELRETLHDKEQKIKNLSFFSDRETKELTELNLTEREAIEVIARNLREGRISTAKIKQEISAHDSIWDEGSLLELIEQEYSFAVDEEKNPVCTRRNKIYDKSGNLTGEDEEQTAYRTREGTGEREYSVLRKSYDFSGEERIQTGEEEYIESFSKKKDLQFSKTFFQYGKRIYKRTDRIQKGDVSEEYKDLSTIAETGTKLLFARLLEKGSEELNIRHNSHIFYNSIETEEREVRITQYKSQKNPSFSIMRTDLLKGYSNVLPLWILMSSTYDQIETQYLFEGIKDSTVLDRFDKSTLFHKYRGTLRQEELKGEPLKEVAKIQARIDEETVQKLRSEYRSDIEMRFAEKANKFFNIQTIAYLKNNSPSNWIKKGDEISISEMTEHIIYCIYRYGENTLRRTSALEKKHTFLPLIISGELGIEALVGQKFGLDLVFLLWEMLNIIGHTEGKDRFASIKI
ncbi:MAG: hypothetical protein ABRQ37_02820 [Candidatus Eremiobacterota bacterium]